jgi:hypothetical protein
MLGNGKPGRTKESFDASTSVGLVLNCDSHVELFPAGALKEQLSFQLETLIYIFEHCQVVFNPV